MQLKHTPGPWCVGQTHHVKHGGGIEGVEVAIHYGPASNRGNCIATAYGHGPHGDAVADARLMAAAPELLSELQRLVQFLELEDARLANFGEVEAARAVIAKAIGT